MERIDLSILNFLNEIKWYYLRKKNHTNLHFIQTESCIKDKINYLPIYYLSFDSNEEGMFP